MPFGNYHNRKITLQKKKKIKSYKCYMKMWKEGISKISSLNLRRIGCLVLRTTNSSKQLLASLVIRLWQGFITFN